jgi:hypothetical protein
MRRFLILATIALVLLSATLLWAANSIDKHIQDLKNSDPDVRAKAAYDLGCG